MNIVDGINTLETIKEITSHSIAMSQRKKHNSVVFFEKDK
jgi:hypothetical protein